MEYRARLWIHRALVRIYRALLRIFKALLQIHLAFVQKRRSGHVQNLVFQMSLSVERERARTGACDMAHACISRVTWLMHVFNASCCRRVAGVLQVCCRCVAAHSSKDLKCCHSILDVHLMLGRCVSGVTWHIRQRILYLNKTHSNVRL